MMLNTRMKSVTETMLKSYGESWFCENAPKNMVRALRAGVAPKNLDAYRDADEKTLLALEAKAKTAA